MRKTTLLLAGTTALLLLAFSPWLSADGHGIIGSVCVWAGLLLVGRMLRTSR